ncbi:proline--tRNA ligase [Thermoleophilia bacterium SCSIO 60948]|nr:proline--tRNA ligase [Thermoleophilia bacterium SCSIO 60948]
MTRLSEAFLPTLRDDPAGAEALSHKLMVRAGLIRQVGAGLYTWLPAGLRSVRKAETIVREEMDAIGAQEMLMPVLNPAELWQSSGRYEAIGPELFRLSDRRDAPMVLAMTHEENITFHVARELRSYRELPKLLYHIQTKERDEPRPRAGVLRTREFVMKDAYSFDRDAEGLDASYERFIGAYDRICDRAGLDWHRVASDVGMMGGSAAHEYMAPCAAGEDEVCLAPGYAANMEIASAEPQAVERPRPLDALEAVSTPGAKTVEQVSRALEVDPGALLKALPVVLDGGELVCVLVRGDHQLNEIKLRNALGQSSRPATEDEIAAQIGPAGFIGPVGLDRRGVRIVCDEAIAAAGGGGWVCGANSPDEHLRGVEPGRDFGYETADVRRVEPGDLSPNGDPIEVVPAIEVGNIFKLGTRYSEPMGATYLDPDGNARPIVMGSYGIGPARIVAASIEQRADERGIAWPAALAPWRVELVSLGKPGDEVTTAAEGLYEELRADGIEVLLDDRAAGAGEKLTDAELIGVPLRVVFGRRGLAEGRLETQVRSTGEDGSLALEGAAAAIRELIDGG